MESTWQIDAAASTMRPCTRPADSASIGPCCDATGSPASAMRQGGAPFDPRNPAAARTTAPGAAAGPANRNGRNSNTNGARCSCSSSCSFAPLRGLGFWRSKFGNAGPPGSAAAVGRPLRACYHPGAETKKRGWRVVALSPDARQGRQGRCPAPHTVAPHAPRRNPDLSS